MLHAFPASGFDITFQYGLPILFSITSFFSARFTWNSHYLSSNAAAWLFCPPNDLCWLSVLFSLFAHKFYTAWFGHLVKTSFRVFCVVWLLRSSCYFNDINYFFSFYFYKKINLWKICHKLCEKATVRFVGKAVDTSKVKSNDSI